MTAAAMATERSAGLGSDRSVGVWLLWCCAAIFAMALIGAATRLTGSGLSITEWSPIMGALPPMSEAEWQRLFDLYRATPEYLHVNVGMTLAEFRTIFWWEYVHRLWGRMIGLLFVVPLIWFWWRGRIGRPLGLKLCGIFLLGGLQGAIGWWMVKSGLVDRPDVSQYRLALHLSLALLLYGLVFWMAIDILAPRRAGRDPAGRGAFAWWIVGAVAVTIVAGAFVAGTNAGLLYNSFPWMGDGVIPPDYLATEPAWLNAFENPAAIQFNHRLLGILTFALVMAFWLRSLSAQTHSVVRVRATWLAVAAVVQIGLGIATLLLMVPILLGVLHQAGAIVLLSLALWLAHASIPRQPAAGPAGSR